MSDDLVDCPFDDCDGRFDPAEMSSQFDRRPKTDGATRADVACESCGATFSECHDAVDDTPSVEYISTNTNNDGTTEIVDENGEEVTA